MNDRGSKILANFLPADGVLVLDRSNRVMGNNQAFGQLLGIHPEPGDTLGLDALFDGPDLGSAQAALDSAMRQGKTSSGLRGRVTDNSGQTFTCEYGIYPLLGPGRQVSGVIITLHDLDFGLLGGEGPETAETAPHLPKVGFQTLFENLAEGIFTINTRWRITSFNQAAERITGFPREEVLGRMCWDVFRSDLCQASCPLRVTLETGLSRMDQDVRILSKDGNQLSILTNTSVVKDRGGTVVGAVESFRVLSGLEPKPAKGVGQGRRFTDIVGESLGMRRLFNMLPDVAASEASVLITGESGTGKELFAQAIHNNSPRKDGPFVAVNCSALAESLLESELFGHEKAAFTGAVRSKVGRFEMAKGGTLFFDEIGDLKPELQVKLLRVLEERVFERVGGTRLVKMDARIIAATNSDLVKALKERAFREDLYYRLRTVPMNIPPLRERIEDIPLLVDHFVDLLNKTTGKEVRSVDPKVTRRFMAYDWPGNVRELGRVMEYAFVFVKGPVIFPAHLPSLDIEDGDAGKEASPIALPRGADEDILLQDVLNALETCGGRRQEAAEILGISRTSLWRRMKALKLT